MGETGQHHGLWNNLVPVAEGTGPCLQRDYWAVIRGCRLSPIEVASFVRERFTDFPPEPLVTFHRRNHAHRPLDVGDELEVRIRMERETGVRVVHVDANSLTLATMQGHPEAGRITFGSYRNERGDVIFHIRSRARSSSAMRFAGFLTLGKPMQTNTWTDFIDCLAHSLGDGVIGAIWIEEQEMDVKTADDAPAPTFIARGN